MKQLQISVHERICLLSAHLIPVVLVPAACLSFSSWRKDFQSNASIDDIVGHGAHLPASRHAPRYSSAAVNICRAASGSRRRGRSRSDGHLLLAGGVTDSLIVTLWDEWQSKEQNSWCAWWVGKRSGKWRTDRNTLIINWISTDHPDVIY